MKIEIEMDEWKDIRLAKDMITQVTGQYFHDMKLSEVIQKLLQDREKMLFDCKNPYVLNYRPAMTRLLVDRGLDIDEHGKRRS